MRILSRHCMLSTSHQMLTNVTNVKCRACPLGHGGVSDGVPIAAQGEEQGGPSAEEGGAVEAQAPVRDDGESSDRYLQQ